MTDLSPAARAVLEAVTWKKYDVPPEGLPAFAEEMAPLLAVALRAAADQVLDAQWQGRIDPNTSHSLGINWSRDALYAIAAELEAQ